MREEFEQQADQLPEEEMVEASYMLEAAANCPHCRETLHAVEVVRLLRTRVNFVSSLPRRGQVMICPACRMILSGSLGGLI